MPNVIASKFEDNAEISPPPNINPEIKKNVGFLPMLSLIKDTTKLRSPEIVNTTNTALFASISLSHDKLKKKLTLFISNNTYLNQARIPDLDYTPVALYMHKVKDYFDHNINKLVYSIGRRDLRR
jgi:hypothetical protein